MDFNQLVSWYFQRSNDMQTFWNFYVTIILALLVFFGGARNPRSKFVAVLLSLAFLMFAAVNLDGLLDVTRQRNKLAQLACATEGHSQTCPPTEPQNTQQELLMTLNPPPLPLVIGVHIIGDLLALAGIWYFVLKRHEAESATSSRAVAAS